MRTIFRYRLARLRGQMLGWGISLALYGLLMAQFYGTILDQQEEFEKLLEHYPKELMAFFGDVSELATPSGYLDLEYFAFLPLILGVFAILTGSGLMVSDEESGRLDLIMAHPVSRGAFYWGRVLAMLVATVVILVISWAGLYIPTAWTPLDLGWPGLSAAFLSLLAVMVLFGALALMLSTLLPSRRMAASVTGLFLVASYFFTSLARINADLEPVAKLMPLDYYQGGKAMDGLNVTWVIGLFLVAVPMALLAWWRFERRDIRVAGEGGWQRPAFSALARSFLRRVSAGREAGAPEGAMAQR